jgi:mono/diheme cytochrome c family protein
MIVSCGGDSNKNTSAEKTTTSTKKSKSVLDEMKDLKSEKKEAPVKKSTSSTSEEAQDDQNAEGATPEQLAKAESIIKGVSKGDLDDIDPKKLFKINCALCHGFKGNMMVNGAKDLTKSEISMKEAVAQIYHGKGLMTPYKGILSDAEIVAVAKYAETLRK